MVSLRTCVVALACTSSALGASIQNPFIHLPSSAAKHRQDVKNIFLDSWNAYM